MKAKALLCAVALALLSAHAVAGPDEAQRQAIQRVIEAKQRLAKAEQAKGAERERLMREHMELMQDAMEKMRASKPDLDADLAHQRDWIAEHQKLMDQMMGQMMEQHRMVMESMRK